MGLVSATESPLQDQSGQIVGWKHRLQPRIESIAIAILPLLALAGCTYAALWVCSAKRRGKIRRALCAIRDFIERLLTPTTIVVGSASPGSELDLSAMGHLWPLRIPRLGFHIQHEYGIDAN